MAEDEEWTATVHETFQFLYVCTIERTEETWQSNARKYIRGQKKRSTKEILQEAVDHIHIEKALPKEDLNAKPVFDDTGKLKKVLIYSKVQSFCLGCKELENRLANSRNCALLRQCAINLEMLLKCNTLGYIDEALKRTLCDATGQLPGGRIPLMLQCQAERSPPKCV